MRIDNQRMLAAFRERDEVLYFYDCHDITMAGVDWYKITEVRYFVKDPACPLADYISIKNYNDEFYLMGVHTRDEALVREAAAEFYAAPEGIKEWEVRADYPEVKPVLEELFILTIPEENQVNPIYAIRSGEHLPCRPLPENVTVTLATEEDKRELERKVEGKTLSEEEMGPWIFTTYPCFKDTRLYLLKVDGEIIGYLRAECGYENYYDVGWLGIAPSERGKGYGTMLALAFTHDCFNNGLMPHYGFAITPDSVKVAEKCGYFNTRTPVTAWNCVKKNDVTMK